MIFRFGPFELSPGEGELRKRGILVRLAPQPLQMLTVLMEHAGELVSRDELRGQLWGQDGTSVEFDAGLNRCVRQIRTALADDAETPRYIATEPRKGYRFIAPVEKHYPAVAQAPAFSPAPCDRPAKQPSPVTLPTQRRLLWISLTATLLIIGIGAAWLVNHRLQPSLNLNPELNPDLNPVPLAVALGDQFSPTFSPDGRQVAFVWNGEDQTNFDIYVKLIGSSSAPLRLTTSPAVDYSPAWSRDGRWIAFCQGGEGSGGTILIIPALGGDERKIVDLDAPASPWTRSIDWSSDSKYLVVSQRPAGKVRRGLYLVNIENGESRPITTPASDEQDINPAISPDGRELAFTRDIGLGVSSIMVLPYSASNSTKDLTARTPPGDIFNAQPAWTPDSRNIVFASNAGGDLHLWLVPRAGSTQPRELRALGDGAEDPAVSTNGQLAFVRETSSSNIWKVDLHDPSNAIRIAASTRVDQSPSVSPDATHIAFESNRSGYSEIWTSRIDGSNTVQLTNLQNPVTGSPDWSPDGRRIVFDSRTGGRPQIYVVSAEGGNVEKLTSGNRSSVVPRWSADGESIYYSSDTTGRMEVWRMAAPGGASQQITFEGGFSPVPSRDGESLYYKSNKLLTSPLWELRLATGNRTRVSSSVPNRAYAPAQNGVLFFSNEDGESRHRLLFFDKRTLRTTLIFEADGRPGIGMTLAKDGRTLFYTQKDRGGHELFLVNQFWK